MNTGMPNSKETTTQDAWLQARMELLAREKEFTRLRDELSARRRALPRHRLEKSYTFEGKDGPVTLDELFGRHDQLLVYHFMYGTDWEAGCPSCSFWADHFDAMIPHLAARNTAFAVVSKGPISKLVAYAERMGWNFRWVSSSNNTFNEDFFVSFSADEVERKDPHYNFRTLPPMSPEMPGASAFARESKGIFRTYSTYARGLDILNPTYHWLDLTAKGRDEDELPFTMAWVRRHDEYDS